MLIYCTENRIPSEKANGYQIMKTCEAFSKYISVELYYPYRVQGESTKCSPYKYYSIEENPELRLTEIRSIDGLYIARRIAPSLRPYGVILHSKIHNLLLERMLRGKEGGILYTRNHRILKYLSRKSHVTSKFKIVYEAHIFSHRIGNILRSNIASIFKIVTITSNLKRIYIENGIPEHKIMVAHDGVDLERFNVSKDRQYLRRFLDLPQSGFIIGYVGRFHTMNMDKGIPNLISAMRTLRESHDEEAYLMCVGGPMNKVGDYVKMICEGGMDSKYFIFRDKVPSDVVPLYLNACDILTIPFPWSEHMAYYTSPMKMFEYLASNTAIAASDLPSLREVLSEDVARFHEAGNSKEMASIFSIMLGSESLRMQLVRAANRIVHRYTWDTRVRQILDNIGYRTD